MTAPAQPTLPPTPAIEIDDRSAIADARRLTRLHAAAAGLANYRAEQAAIVSSELAGNLLRHARGGLLMLRTLNAGVEPRGIAITAVDEGPGISDITAAFEDGTTTSGTAGLGLGAVRRLSDVLQIASTPEAGTVLYTEIRAEETSPTPPALSPDTFGAAIVQHPLCDCSGDALAVAVAPPTILLALIDGLGHGPGAATAAQAVAESIRNAPSGASAADIILTAHDAARKTRGAAVAVARIIRESGEIDFCGIGNITAAIVTPGEKARHLVSTEGIVGHTSPRIMPMQLPLQPGQRLLMASDGLKTGWTGSRDAMAFDLSPALQAARLLLHHRRLTDDASVLAWSDSHFSTAP